MAVGDEGKVSGQESRTVLPSITLPSITLIPTLPKDCNAILTRVLVDTVDRGLINPTRDTWHRRRQGMRPLMAARISVVPESEVPIPQNWTVPVSLEDDFEKVLILVGGGDSIGSEGQSATEGPPTKPNLAIGTSATLNRSTEIGGQNNVDKCTDTTADSAGNAVAFRRSDARTFDTREGDIDAEGWSGSEHLRKAIERLSLPPEDATNGWTSQIGRLPRSQLSHEKRRVKQELKSYDVAFTAVHGRSPGRTDKEPMRPLYTYYRGLKQAMEEVETGGGGGGPTHISANEKSRAGRFGQQPEEEPSMSVSSNRLMMRLQSLIDEKSRIREGLQQYQARFFVENQRKIKYHKDIVPIEREYREYKQVKEEIAQLERKLGIGPSKEHHHHDD
ncbi:hypothetical protein FOL47_001470 [Perkinsus chesapeaki]|uniref:FAM13A-like domain-containing protein n=1 Tax=Perkinsus chesapeaki TaxID=330153 RepID=A0A7J6MJD4_PERCH|nr:hypothetical protein FOL47_001470 [Perkinsus chesapeaki]